MTRSADTRVALAAYWERYRAALEAGDSEEMKRWTLQGVRLEHKAPTCAISLSRTQPRRA